MRRTTKNSLIEIFKTLYEAHEYIKKFVEKEKNEELQILLNDCQQTAIQIGTIIEGSEGEGNEAISFLEAYCETIYEIATSGELAASKTKKMLDRKLMSAESSVKNIKERLEVVFMPYKSSMWDSLESIWKAADADPDCDAYVVPIPYYDRNPDRTFGEFHYEGKDYPEYVPVVHYESYDLSQRCPDIIFIHNPYDEHNFVTTVDPRFYSSELKKYTECLVYVPYYVMHIDVTETLACSSAVINADYVFVQNKETAELHFEYLKKYIDINILKEKIIPCGSPKIDKMINYEKKMVSEKASFEGTTGKKVVFFNTNISLLLHKGEAFIEDLQRVFGVFERNKDKFVLIWREHPLTIGTLKSMHPRLLKKYLEIKELYIKNNIGIIDENPEAYVAMSISDCYYGAAGSLAVVYGITGKPMLITTYKNPLKTEDISIEELLTSNEDGFLYRERNLNALELFINNLDEFEKSKQQRLERLYAHIDNHDGTSGEKIYNYVKTKKID